MQINHHIKKNKFYITKFIPFLCCITFKGSDSVAMDACIYFSGLYRNEIICLFNDFHLKKKCLKLSLQEKRGFQFCENIRSFFSDYFISVKNFISSLFNLDNIFKTTSLF